MSDPPPPAPDLDAAPSAAPVHATAVAIGGRAVLLTGASGAGKSDLALRLIDRGATLVADDYVALAPRAGRLHASPPAAIAGRMEVRGIGIVAMPHCSDIPIALLLRLDDKPDRMPSSADIAHLEGIAIPVLALDPRAPSAAITVELALRRFGLAIDGDIG